MVFGEKTEQNECAARRASHGAPAERQPVGHAPVPEPEAPAGEVIPSQLEVVIHDSGGDGHQVYPLVRPTTTIGRDPSNDIVITSPVIPRFYAVIEREDGRAPLLLVRDNTAALFYHGRCVEELELRPGTVLRAGDPNGSLVTFRYQADDAVRRPPLGKHISLTRSPRLLIGRAPTNQLVLDDEAVAPHHARIERDAAGQVTLTDLGRTTGTYVNGIAVEQARLVPGCEIRIGSHHFVFTGLELVEYDQSSEVRVDAIDLTQTVHVGGLGPLGRTTRVILDHVSLTLLPGTFVAIVGASGSGKTTLLGALNGQRPVKSGEVLYNGEDYYANYDTYRQSLGYVPQDDIVHKNLTVETALLYAARLRLPKGTSRKQIRERVDEALEDVELSDQRRQPIESLSGGQRKRVNIALELLARPSLFYLDEPNSGLDPGLDRKMMQLLRRLADRGHTIVLTTHATTNINVCDYVCFLAPGGRLAFFGTPQELRQHFGKGDYAEIYNEVDAEPERWAALYRQSPEYLRYVQGPQAQSRNLASAQTPAAAPQHATPSGAGSWRQFRLLTRRYFELLLRDPTNVLILLAQAPIIAVFIVILARSNVLRTVSTHADLAQPLDIYAQRTLFIMTASAIWFGTINAAREIVKETPIYRRERAVVVGVVPYVLSKVVALGVLCIIQDYVLLYIVGTTTGYPTHGVLWPGTSGAFAEMYISLLLGSLVGLMLGLLISALAPNTDRAISIVPIVLIPQIIFANVIFTLRGWVGTWISYVMPARWTMQALGSIDAVRDRFSDHATSPFYTHDASHVLGFWALLVLQALVLFAITLVFQRLKDVRPKGRRGSVRRPDRVTGTRYAAQAPDASA
jgi:ABC-type multidrug transport system ATPase subunit/pSer/pThr/pTyr-binding forkhead associated (FHA) protein